MPDFQNHLGEIIGTGLGGVLGFAGGLGLATLATPVSAPTGAVVGGIAGATDGGIVGYRIGGKPGAGIGAAGGAVVGAVAGAVSIDAALIGGGTIGGGAIGNVVGRKIDQEIAEVHDHGLGAFGLSFGTASHR